MASNAQASNAQAINAQAMRAILLANATLAFLAGILASRRANQGESSGLARARPIRPVAAITNSWRKQRSPALVMLPRRGWPPVELCAGASPIQAANWRPLLNRLASPHQRRLLGHALQRHELHARPAHRLAAGLRVDLIVLVAHLT